MEGEYYDRSRGAMREDLDGPLGEDGPVQGEVGAGVGDRGLFGRRHGHGSYDGEYAAEVGGGGYGGRSPMPYDGGYGDGYGGYERRRPPPEVVYEGGYGGSGGYGGGPPVYVESAEAPDLGTGLMGSDIRTKPDYGSGCGASDLAGVYDDRGRLGGRHGHSMKDDEDLDDERKHKHYAEAAAAAAIGYGLYERHQKNDAEEKLEEVGYDSDGKKKHDHHFRDY